MNNSVDRGGGNGLMRDALGALGLYYLADNILSCLVAAIVAPIFLLCFGGLIFTNFAPTKRKTSYGPRPKPKKS